MRKAPVATALASTVGVGNIADTLNGLMAVSNLVAVLGSAALIRKLVREFFEKKEFSSRG